MLRTKYLCTLIFMLLLATLSPVSTATAAVRPDLTVTAVTVKKAEAAVGEQLTVTVGVKNAGSRVATASRTALYLSTDKRRGKGDIALGGKASTPRLQAGDKAKAVVRSVVPRGVPAGAYRVIACADAAKSIAEAKEGNNCRASRSTVRIVVRSSDDKIDAAEAAGLIDADTAARYRILALFDDQALPKRYRGDDSATLESHAFDDAFASWDTLSPETQRVVKAYAAPPFYEGSAWAPMEDGAERRSGALADTPGCDLTSIANDWKYVEAVGGRVRVWHQTRYEDNLKAVEIADTIEKKIYPALEKLMGFEHLPLPDGGGMCDGGSPAIDLALVDADTDTAVRKNWFSCKSPAHILLDRGRAGYLPFVAHELMHAVQYTYDVQGSCSEYHWLREATAQWFMDYISDARYGFGVQPDDTEWLYQAPDKYLLNPEVPLESTSPQHHEYGSYLWFFFVARFGNAEGYVKQVWDLTPEKSSLDAVRTPLAGNFDAYWKEFVKTNWNRDDIDDYRDWDGLEKKAATTNYPLSEGEEKATVKVDHLAAKYFTFTPAPNLTNVIFDNEAAGVAGAGVQAIITYKNGTQKVEDWSDKSRVELCLRNPDVKTITLVFSNSNADPASELSFDVMWTGQESVCCQGTAAPQRTGGAELAATEGTPCPSVFGTITYTETDSWEAPADGCCAGSESLTISYQVRMAADPLGGWVDAGSTYDVSFTSQQSGHGKFGIAECDYHDSYQGYESGLLKIAAGEMVEKGEYSPVTGTPAVGRELLLSVGDWDIGYTLSGTKTYSGCENPSHDAVVTEGPTWIDLRDPSIAGECEGYPPYLWMRGGAKSRTLTYSCTGTDENGRTETVTATITF